MQPGHRDVFMHPGTGDKRELTPGGPVDTLPDPEPRLTGQVFAWVNGVGRTGKGTALTEPSVMFQRIGRVMAAALLGVLGTLASPAAGQQTRIPPDVISANSIAPDQQQEIARYVNENIARLKSDDPKDIREGRRALLEPLGNTSIQVAFRLAYGDLLKPELARLMNDPALATSVEAQNRAIAALVVAADIATGDSIDLLVGALGSAREDLRHQAAYGLRRTFEAIHRTPPAAPGAAVQRAIRALGDRLPVETNALVLQADINALREAGLVDRPGIAVQPDAIGALAAGVKDLIKAREGKMPDRELLGVLLRAATVRDLLQPGRARVPDAQIRQAAEIGGDLVAFVARAAQAQPSRVPMGEQPPPEPTTRELFAQTAKAGETLILFARQLLDATGGQPQSVNLDNDLRQGTTRGDANFLANAGRLVGAQGMLSQAPFGFPANRFPMK